MLFVVLRYYVFSRHTFIIGFRMTYAAKHRRVDGEVDTRLFTTFKWKFNQLQFFSDIALIFTCIDFQDWHPGMFGPIALHNKLGNSCVIDFADEDLNKSLCLICLNFNS